MKKITESPKSKISNVKSAIKVDWSQLYLDLPENVAKILRDSRVKPEQLKEKTDGDILSIKGITETDLETIKAKYPAEMSTQPSTVSDQKDENVQSKISNVKSKSNSPFYKYPRQLHGRSARYLSMKKKIKTESMTFTKAIETIVSLSRRPGTLEAHINVIETGLRGEVKLPFSTGKTIKVEIFSDQTITALNDNRMDFDILLASPADMPKLARFAKILGPKGLMPNPKNGTVTTDPEKRSKELMAGSSLSYKTEPKAPIIHLGLGKTSQKVEELSANLTATLKDIGATKLISVFLTGSQTPSIKLDLSEIR